ncbi:hypothetical protein ACFT4A_04385 [Streptomyces sp. NPDC057099]|uniref:hypothetical protein n=1 Tax=Streptomyces sp. NPDC057099 TaxID=3346019 RepID=UPI0036442FD4
MSDTMAAFTARAAEDPAVVGPVLSGSQVHEGMTTVHSDHDLHVIVGDDTASPLTELDGFRSAHLDLVVIPLAEFRTRGMPGRPDHFARYSYVNQTYRSLKSYRDGHPAMGHLDAAESVPYALEVLFALHRRVRPYNKYLRWELERSPLGDRRWGVDRLLPVVERLLADGDPGTQRALFTDVEEAARKAGHGEVLGSWGADLELLRHP